MLKKIIWDENSTPLRDSECEEQAKQFLAGPYPVFRTCNELFINYARVLCYENKDYKPGQLILVFGSREYPILRSGRIESWPEEMKYVDDFLTRLVGF